MREVDTYLDADFRVVAPDDPSAKFIRKQTYNERGELVKAAFYIIKDQGAQ